MPDTEVIDLCGQITRDYTAVMHLADTAGDHPSAASIVAAGRASIERVAAMPAVTLAGMRGKARVLACLEGDHPALAASLASDVLRDATV